MMPGQYVFQQQKLEFSILQAIKQISATKISRTQIFKYPIDILWVIYFSRHQIPAKLLITMNSCVSINCSTTLRMQDTSHFLIFNQIKTAF